MSPESWAGWSLWKVKRKQETGFRSNETAWTEYNVPACVLVMPFVELALGDNTSLQVGITN